MKKISMLIVALAIFAGAQMLVPNKSEAGMKCSTDFYGNTTCVETGGDPYSGGSVWKGSKTDIYGNQNWSSNTGQSFSCRTDFYGNLVCN